ncbi:nitrate- and nitrite sensing domain-containing protein [Streptomyces sp. NPDC101132]|uniref:sensor histidine kinase n=1 Tax=Streptomyces sp. NPDC101132 TaxID=3366110 RepID=UPI00382298A9
MQKKRSRKNGSAPAGAERTGDATGTGGTAGRPVRVRSRLVLGVAVVALAVAGAGTPALIAASAELNDSQRLVTLAEHTRATVTLAHALADERDAVVAYVAAGRAGKAQGQVKQRAERVDGQVEEARDGADADLARALDRIAAVRKAAVSGKGTATAAETAYSELLGELLAPAGELAERTPPRAAAALATSRALAPLSRAVEQASATRGLLLAALAVPAGEEPGTVYDPVTGRYEDAPPSGEEKTRDELTAAAQRARVREQAALEDFDRAARPDVRETLAATVSGPEVKAAEAFLAKLTDEPRLSAAERKLDAEAVAAALSARIDRMRSVESTLTAERATALAALRDDDVTSGEVLLGLVGLLVLVSVGVSTAVARTLTQPLSVLRRGAERLASPDHEGGSDPVRFTGRNDEFAAVVRSLNEIHARAEAQSTALHTRIAGLDADRRRLIGRNDALSAAKTALDKELAELKANLEEHRKILLTTSVSLSLRTLGLVERQLTVIEQLEAKEQDPDRLATLFKLDHLATVMRRHNENLLVLAGQEHGHGQSGPVPLVDVMRAAISEIERYERVDLQALPAYTQVAGHAADDVSHVVAELLENATTFSPPDAKVKVSGWTTDDGSVVVSVQDGGIGVTEDRLALLNARLADPEAFEQEDEAEHGLGLGLYVAGRLAARHGVTAELRARRGGGTEALVVVPEALLPTTPPAQPEYRVGEPGAPELQLPGIVAEANSNVLPPRFRPVAEPTGSGSGSGSGSAGTVPGAREAEHAAAPEAGTVPEPVREARPAPEAPEPEPQPQPQPVPGTSDVFVVPGTAGPAAQADDWPLPATEPVPAPDAAPISTEPEASADAEAVSEPVADDWPPAQPDGAPETHADPERAAEPEHLAEPEASAHAVTESVAGGRRARRAAADDWPVGEAEAVSESEADDGPLAQPDGAAEAHAGPESVAGGRRARRAAADDWPVGEAEAVSESEADDWPLAQPDGAAEAHAEPAVDAERAAEPEHPAEPETSAQAGSESVAGGRRSRRAGGDDWPLGDAETEAGPAADDWPLAGPEPGPVGETTAHVGSEPVAGGRRSRRAGGDDWPLGGAESSGAEAPAEREVDDWPLAVAEPAADAERAAEPAAEPEDRAGAEGDDWPLAQPAAGGGASAAGAGAHAADGVQPGAGAHAVEGVQSAAGTGDEPEAWVLAAPLPRPAAAGDDEPHRHDRTAQPEPESDEDTEELERPLVTDKGLPKRTPRVVEHGTQDVRKPAARVDAEELRRRLGGFYQGARDGRRVVDAELAEERRQRAEDEGDTVEEART